MGRSPAGAALLAWLPVAALAQAIATRLADPELAAAEGKRGRVRAETLFDRDRMTGQIVTLTEKLVSQRGPR